MAIENFEAETHELTDYELNTLLPLVKSGLLKRTGEENSVTSTHIVNELVKKGYSINGPRLRKIINYIRVNNIIYNLIATNNGYFIASSESECRSFIRSLDQRINSIITMRDAMAYQLKKSLE